jgi:hypothetical protein
VAGAGFLIAHEGHRIHKAHILIQSILTEI